MLAFRSLSDVEHLGMAMLLAMPRILAVFIVIPVFHRDLIPRLVFLGAVMVLAMVLAPVFVAEVDRLPKSPGWLVLMIGKEVFVGFALGCLLALPFWAFEALGFLVDNQRGASISATLNPLTGNDSSPLGLLYNQAFIVFFMVSGGLLILLDTLYRSFEIWNVVRWTPTLEPASIPFFITELLRLVGVGVLLAAPPVVAMLLAEIGLGLVSLTVPQLQVFFLAMPVKSAIALLVLVLYGMTLFEYGSEYVEALGGVLPKLEQQWQAPPGGTR